MYDPGPDDRLPEQMPKKPVVAIVTAIALAALICSLGYAAIQDGPEGFPTNSLRPSPQPPKQKPWIEDEVVRKLPAPIQVYDSCQDHCMLDEDRCTEVAKDKCREAMRLPPGSTIKLTRKHFEMGRACNWTCANGESYECTGPESPRPRPEDQTMTQ